MKKLFKTMLPLCFFFIFICPVGVFAVGEGNIDGGGGTGMGSGSSNNKWSVGNEGVRVTVVRASDHEIVTTSIDLTNITPATGMYHFGKVSKLQYSEGASLHPVQGGYAYKNPRQAVPKIISLNGTNNIKAIKSYFTDEQVIRSIAETVGMNFDVLINGDYKLLLEPIAYIKFQGVMVAATATEMAMYDEQTSGLIRKYFVSLSHQNLPLSMFLEVADLGYPAWGGSKKTPATNADIKSSLGLGVVRFTEKPEPPAVFTYDYEYRVNTEVITAVRVRGGQSDPDKPTRVTFNIQGKSYNVGNVYYPSGDSQLAWVRWTTPKEPQTMTIIVTVSGSGSAQGSIHVNVVDLDKNPPPNPIADDRNDSFSYVTAPSRAVKSSANWSVWRPWWYAYWVWHRTGKNSGYWCDHGWWEFDLDRYSASLTATMQIKCDDKNPTASGRTMKSGYGINQTVTGNVSSNQSSAVTQPQNAVSYFPEFRYETYWRLLERMGSGRFEFHKNKYSTYKNRTHFSPIWMPDGPYTVNTWLIDAWTPEGMMSSNLIDSLTIKGNLWQDWHVAPLSPK